MDLVDKFDAKGKSGEGYHVEVYQDDDAEHAKLYKLKDGRPLEALSDAKFRLVQTGEKIYRI